MNYIRELNAFRDWLMVNRLSSGQIALWHMLMSFNNRAGWQEWFTLPNQTLQLVTGLSRQGLSKARNGLIQAGLIQYKKGRSSQAGSYRMQSLLQSDCQIVGTKVVTVVDTPVDKVVGTPGAQQLTDSERKSSTLFKQETQTQTEKKKEKQVKEKSSSFSAQVQEIWDHYLTTFAGFFRKLSLTAKRKQAIQARLQEGYTVEEIKLAISQIRQSSFHCGDNDTGKFYADITFVCRNGEKIEEWMNHQAKRGNPNATGSGITSNGQKASSGVVIGVGKYAGLE